MSCKGVIRQLDTHVRAQLRSGVAITSPAQCVEELLLNALDAGATCVAVRLDFSCFKVQVVDNGKGMSTEDLEVLGERYFTSKCHTVEDLDSLHYFGYRGEAIASMRETCKVLEIVSRTKNSIKTYCKIFHHSKPKPVAESSIPRPSVGTTITAHYLFYNLPVRQKALKETLEIEMIKQRVEGIALMKPDISISLRNDETGQVLLQTQKCQSVLMTFTRLFGTEKSRSLVEVTGSKDQFSITGYIGKESHTKKNIQFVYVNGRLVLKTKLHKLFSETLAKSIIMKKKSNVHNSPAGAQGSPTKHGQRYPMFILNVKCPLSEYDITFEPAKTLVEFKNWEVLSTLVSGTVESFLRKENLFIGLKGALLDENGDDMHAIEGIEGHEADVAANNSIVKEVLSDSIYGSVSEENDNSDDKTKIDEKHVEKIHTFSSEIGNDRIMDIYTSKVEEKSSVRNTDEENIDAAEEDDKKEKYGADVNQLRPEAETDYQKNISSFDTKHSLCSRTVKRLNNKQSSYESEKQVDAGLPSNEVSDENGNVEKDRDNKIGESSQNSLSHGCQDLMEDIDNAETSGRELLEAIATNVDLPDKTTFEHATCASYSDTMKADGDDHQHRADTSTLLNIGPKEQGNSEIRRQKNGTRPKKDTEEESDFNNRQGKSFFRSKLRTKLKSEQIERVSEPQKRRKSTFRKGLAQFRRHPKNIRNHTKQRSSVDESIKTSQPEEMFRNKSQLKEKYMSNSEEMESRLSLFRKPQGVMGCQKKDKKENNNDEHLPDRGHSFTNQLSFTTHKNQSDLQKKQETDPKVMDSLTIAEESPIVSGLKLYRKSIQTQNVPARKRSSSLLQVLAEQTHSSKKVQKLTEEDANSHTSTSRREDKGKNVNVKISIEKAQYHNIAVAESSKLTAINNDSHSFGDSACEGELASNHNTVIYSDDHNNAGDIMMKSRQHQQDNMAPLSKVHTKERRKTGKPSSELPSTSCKLGKLMRHRQCLKDEELNSKGCDVDATVTKSAKHLKLPPYACDIAQTELAITDSANMSNHEILDVSESQPSRVYGDEEYVFSKYRENKTRLLDRSDPLFNFHPREPGQRSKEVDEKGDCCGTNTYDQSVPFSADTQCYKTSRSDSKILPFVLYPAPDIVCTDIHMRSDLSSHNNENVMDACTRPYFLSVDSEKTPSRRKTHMIQWSSSANRDVSTDHIRLSVPSPYKVSTDHCKRLYLSSSATEVSSTDAHMESVVSSLNTKTVNPYIPMRPYSFAANTNIVNKYAHIRSCFPSFNAANSDLLHSDEPPRLPTSSANTETLSTCSPKRLDSSSTPMKLSSSPSSMEMYGTCIFLKLDHLSTRNNLNRNPCTVISNRYFDNASSVPDSKSEGRCSDQAKYLFQGFPTSISNDNTTKHQVKMTMESSGSETFHSQALAYYPSVTDSESSLTSTQNVHKVSESQDSVSFKSDECSKVTFHTCPSLPDKGVGRECNILCSRSPKKENFPKQICSESSISGHYTVDCSNDGTFVHGKADYLANEISHDSSVLAHLGESFLETEEYIPGSEGFKIHSSPCCDTLEKTFEQLPNISPSQGFRPILDHSFQNCKDNKSPGIESQGFSPTVSVHAHNSDSETGSLGFSPNIREYLIEAAENESDQVTSKPKTLALLDTSSPSSKVCSLEIRRELIEAAGKLLQADEIKIASALIVLNQHSSSTDEIGNSDSLQLKLETSDAKENVGTKAEETASIETVTSFDLSQIVKSNDVEANTFQKEQGDAVTFEDIFSSDQSENYINNNKYITKNSLDSMPETVIDSSDVQTCIDKNISQSPHFSTWDASFEDKIIQSEPALQSSCKINDTDYINTWKFDCTNVENHDRLSECTDEEMYSNMDNNSTTKSNSSGTNDCSVIYQRGSSTNEENVNMDKDNDETDEENTWIIVMDPQTGENLHVNTTSGHAIPESQWKRDKPETQDGANNDKPLSNINTKWKRPFALSGGDQRIKMQNLLITESVDAQIKWREGAKGINTDAGNSIESLLKDWENPVFQRPEQDVISVESSTQGNKNLIKAYRNIHPCKFTKDMLSCVKVIGQVDNKFIVCLLRADDKNMSADPDMMVLIDQHAAHERVRLEALMQEAYTETDDDKQVMTQSEVLPPHPLTLKEEEVRMMMAYRKEFVRIGIEFSRDIKTRDTVLIQSIPQCIVEREVNEVKRKRDSVAWDIVETLIKEHVELLQSTRGASGRLPLTLHRVLSSQACHGAIKFGDPLTLDECQALIDSLCQCDLPFQCAHGRPSMMPLLKLQQLKTKIPQQPLRKPKLYVLNQRKEDHQDFN